MKLATKVKFVNTINRYIGRYRKYDLKGIQLEVFGTPIYIKDEVRFNLILKKLYKDIKIDREGIIRAKFKDKTGVFSRINIAPDDRIRAVFPVYGCHYVNRPCRHMSPLCNGDKGLSDWRYNVTRMVSIEDFLVCVIGFVNSFHK